MQRYPVSTPANTGAVHISAAQRGTNHQPLKLMPLLHGGGKAGGTRAFGHVVGIGVEVAHGLSYFGISHFERCDPYAPR